MKKFPYLLQSQNDMDCLILLLFLNLACFVVTTYVIFFCLSWILMAHASLATYLLTRLPHAGLYKCNGRQIEFFHVKWFNCGEINRPGLMMSF